MIHYDHYRPGPGLFGMHYRFGRARDLLPLHADPPERAHNVMVVRGAVYVHVRHPTGELHHFVRPGPPLDFDTSVPHTVEAVYDDTETMHYFLNGEPEAYRQLTDAERKGTIP